MSIPIVIIIAIIACAAGAAAVEADEDVLSVSRVGGLHLEQGSRPAATASARVNSTESLPLSMEQVMVWYFFPLPVR